MSGLSPRSAIFFPGRPFEPPRAGIMAMHRFAEISTLRTIKDFKKGPAVGAYFDEKTFQARSGTSF
jgi:hypothetical protein